MNSKLAIDTIKNCYICKHLGWENVGEGLNPICEKNSKYVDKSKPTVVDFNRCKLFERKAQAMTRFIKAEDAEPYLTRYIPSVDAVSLDDITDMYQNMDSDFIERYYPEYNKFTGSFFVIGDQITQGNLSTLLELWKQYKIYNIQKEETDV